MLFPHGEDFAQENPFSLRCCHPWNKKPIIFILYLPQHQFQVKVTQKRVDGIYIFNILLSGFWWVCCSCFITSLIFNMQSHVTAEPHSQYTYPPFLAIGKEIFYRNVLNICWKLLFSLFKKNPTSKMFFLKSFMHLKYTCFSILHSRSLKYKSLLYFVM